MPPNQLPRSILLALGIIACDDKGIDSADTQTSACLDYPYDTDTGPCLEPHYETGDSGDTGDTADSGDSGDSGDTGETTPCLDYAVSAPETAAGKVAERLRQDGFRGTVASTIAARAEALGAVLDKGVLPDDVAALLAARKE